MSDDTKSGERIAKAIARAGIASRRDAEKMILAGRVSVNGRKVESPALDVLPGDRVTVDGKPIDAPQPTRMWLYYKPVGLVTSARDEKGRQTVFDTLPEGMPRVMSVGRLDLNSEGLLILTNDGELKRRLELPSTGWLRKYRVRVNGRPTDRSFEPLRQGVTIEREAFLPMEVTLDKQQGANAWLTVGLREGRNREIRRSMTEVGLVVNRLIRVSYGPFRLNMMKPGDVVEVRTRVMREQLGSLLDGLAGVPAAPKAAGDRPRKPRKAPEDRRAGPAKPRGRPDDTTAAGGRKPERARAEAAGGDRPARKGTGEARGARPVRRREEKTEGPRPRKAAGGAAGARPFRQRGGDDRPARKDDTGRPSRKGTGEARGAKPVRRSDETTEGTRPRRAAGEAAGAKPFRQRGGDDRPARKDDAGRPPGKGDAGRPERVRRGDDARRQGREDGASRPPRKGAGPGAGGTRPGSKGGGPRKGPPRKK